MSTGFFKVPYPKNEPVLSYAPGSQERKLLQQALKNLRSKELDIPMYIGEAEIRNGNQQRISPPHDHKHTLGYFHLGDREHVQQAIQAALSAKSLWEDLSWETRASIFLKAAEDRKSTRLNSSHT